MSTSTTGQEDSIWSKLRSDLGSIFGNSGSVMEKDSFGNYKTDFWTPEQWREATDKFGVNVGNNGELLDRNGSPLDVKELPAQGGLGGLFKEGGLVSQIGAGAKTGLGLLSLYSMGNDLFGSGRKDRKEAKDMMRKNFAQNYAMNEAAMNKFRDDLNIFRTGQASAKKSFESGSVANPIKTI